MEVLPEARAARAPNSSRPDDAAVPSILGALPPDFFPSYWRRKPLVLRGALPTISSLVDEGELEAFERDYHAAPAAWRNGSVARLGTTSFIANAECINERLAALCNVLRADFRWPHAEVALARNRTAQSWVTSGPHFDQVDNFITQAAGTKQWRLWPTRGVDSDEKRRRVLRLPSYGEHAIPHEPSDLVDVVVEPGDLLYVPLFWGHAVRALEPGIMYSINLKALLPSQVLLRGMASQLAILPDREVPLAIPAEVPDWDAYLAQALADAFAVVSRRLSPSGERSTEEPTSAAATTAGAGLAAHASTRHQSLLRAAVAADDPVPSRHVASVDALLERTEVDLNAFASARSAAELGALLDAFAAVHLHRFLALLSLGPQAWWLPAQREAWAESRERVDAVETASLLGAAGEPPLVELTTAFRNDLLAFNRRHAVATLRRWTDRLQELVTRQAPSGPSMFSDAACTMPATPAAAARVSEALGDIESTWPGFTDVFRRVVGGVAIVRNVWQSRQASRRPRIAVVDADWAQDEIAPALAGEVARIAAQLVERIGAVMPGRGDPYRGAWRSPGSDLPRAAALLANARYLGDVGHAAAAERRRELAVALLGAEPEHLLTPLGADLRASLAAAANPAGPRVDLVPVPAADILRHVEGLQPEDVREFVLGLTSQYTRFRWSDLGIADDRGRHLVAGMDCGIPPWVVG